ncbi:MAG: diguanylate cyclase [Planctomycetaceae bacterium]|nr:diguanylate cyclase [Planctomycetaceae bacterium]
MPKEDLISEPANILLVDDDSAMLRLLSHLLEAEGYRVRAADNGTEALQLAMQESPDVIITDWLMPEMDGLELCRRVRQLYERRLLRHYSYILLLTSQTGRENLLEGLNAGADDSLEKGNDNFAGLKIEILVRLKTALRMRNMQRELEYAAKYDFSTDLLNRSTFFEQGHEIWTKALEWNKSLAAVMVDCDFFKRINDTYGHLAGDAVLASLAKILREHSRTYDVICRYGGEEFCALLPDCDESLAFHWAERIRSHLELNNVCYEGKNIDITASFGVAERISGMESLDQLVEHADQALLFAKESGRNRTVRYSDILFDCHDSPDAIGYPLLRLFDHVMAGDVMIPFVRTVNHNETVASVTDFFLKTRVENMPVIDNNGDFLGFISEKNLLAIVGNKEQWQENIHKLVTKPIVIYEPETPLKTIYNFLVRVSLRRVLIIKNQKPVGYITRNLLLRWLRNRWAYMLTLSGDGVHSTGFEIHSAEIFKDQIQYLLRQLSDLQIAFGSQLDNLSESPQTIERYRVRETTSLASKVQEVADQILITNKGYANSIMNESIMEASDEAVMYRFGLMD